MTHGSQDGEPRSTEFPPRFIELMLATRQSTFPPGPAAWYSPTTRGPSPWARSSRPPRRWPGSSSSSIDPSSAAYPHRHSCGAGRTLCGLRITRGAMSEADSTSSALLARLVAVLFMAGEGADRGAVQRALDLTPPQLRRLLEQARTASIP